MNGNYWSSVYTGHSVSIDGYTSAKVTEFRSLGYICHCCFSQVDGFRKIWFVQIYSGKILNCYVQTNEVLALSGLACCSFYYSIYTEKSVAVII